MNRKSYTIISITACVIAVIGFVAFAGGIRSVNAGVWIFPALIAVIARLIAVRK